MKIVQICTAYVPMLTNTQSPALTYVHSSFTNSFLINGTEVVNTINCSHYTGWSKKEDIPLRMVTLSIAERFSKLFTVTKLTKFTTRYMLHFPLHL